MSDFIPGLEGVIAFETQIAEPDRAGGSLRYRGVDIEELVGHVTYGHAWGLLVDNAFEPGLPPAEPYPIPVHSGDIRVDVQSALAMLAPAWGMRQLLDISDEQARDDLARASVMALSFVAQSARGPGLPMVPQRRVDEARTITERFMIRWRSDPDPSHVKAIDAYWTSAAEHGMNASTFTARVIASTGADVAAAMSGAVGAMSGPLHGGAPARVLHMIEEVERTGDGRSAGEGGARRAARPQAGPGARHERGVLGRDRPRLRAGTFAHVHLDVHLRQDGRLGGAHPGAETDRQAGQAERQVRGSWRQVGARRPRCLRGAGHRRMTWPPGRR